MRGGWGGSRPFTIHRWGFEVCAMGFAVPSNRFELPSNAIALLSNRFVLLSNGFEVSAKGFAVVSKRFAVASKRFAVVSKRFAVASKRFEMISNRLDRKLISLLLDLKSPWRSARAAVDPVAGGAPGSPGSGRRQAHVAAPPHAASSTAPDPVVRLRARAGGRRHRPEACATGGCGTLARGRGGGRGGTEGMR